MPKQQDKLFGTLEPPPGGAERLRARLTEQPVERRFPLVPTLAGAGLAAALGAAAYFALPQLVRDPADSAELTALIDAPEFDRLLGREPPPLTLRVEIGDELVEVEQLASENPAVRIYRLN